VKMNRTVAAMTLVGLCCSTTAIAAENETAPLSSAAERAVPIAPSSGLRLTPAKRPPLLPALYLTLGAVQAWDMYSTSAALRAGATEKNPAVSPFTSNTGSMIGLKAATTAGTIFFAERLWRKNKVSAIIVMAAINGATAAVAMRNMRNARLLVATQ
jgi:hypothetical protein